MSGRLDVDALRRTLDEIMDRHEMLRTTFPAAEGSPVQVINQSQGIELQVIDLRKRPEASREEEAEGLLVDRTRSSFDLARGPLVRAVLLRLEEQEHILLLVTHHIVSDGWSTGVLFQEFGALYEAYSTGMPSPLPELPIQYVDFALWQRERNQHTG